LVLLALLIAEAEAEQALRVQEIMAVLEVLALLLFVTPALFNILLAALLVPPMVM
jgi:hypothetical protein